jgi:hypothetical protein
VSAVHCTGQSGKGCVQRSLQDVAHRPSSAPNFIAILVPGKRGATVALLGNMSSRKITPDSEHADTDSLPGMDTLRRSDDAEVSPHEPRRPQRNDWDEV